MNRKAFLIQVWRNIRAPFCLPRHNVVHVCQYEKIDIDICGCTHCGWVHVCSVHVEDKYKLRQCQDVVDFDTNCQKELTEENIVCLKTGFCLPLSLYSTLEFSDTVSLPTPCSPKRTIQHKHDYVRMCIQEMLCSCKALRCWKHETNLLYHKLKTCFSKVMKRYSCTHQDYMPNYCDIVCMYANASKRLKVTTTRYDRDVRMQIVHNCSVAVSRIIHILLVVAKDVIATVKEEILIVGLLYLMRSGLVIGNMSILPKLQLLETLLPTENNLFAFFGIKCKTITETENLVKLQLRGTPLARLRQFGMHHQEPPST